MRKCGIQDPLVVRRLPYRLTGDARRTIIRFFWPEGDARAVRIAQRVLELKDSEVAFLLHEVRTDFEGRHPDFLPVLMDHYRQVRARAPIPAVSDPARRLLIGAYFTMEYAFESAALFNPSMVPALDQDGVRPGCVRFIMSLRAVGEGHISSIVFRRGIVDPDGNIALEPISPRAQSIRQMEDHCQSHVSFRKRFIEMDAYSKHVEIVLERLPDPFTHVQLLDTVSQLKPAGEADPAFDTTLEQIIWMVKSNYEVTISQRGGMDEVVIFPVSQREKHGMEDMRLVRFVEDDGTARYCGTYTAYDGISILPQLMEYHGGNLVRMCTLHGKMARNKGFALFPRRVHGKYMMIGRVDGVNLFLLRSNSLYTWNEGQLLDSPRQPWELFQIGNCGSPLETEAGWLLLTHGVGPMRRYCIGAILLDRDDPSKVLGRLEEPLLSPTAEERSGYVPNVVYSCGAMIHNDLLILPYGISDAVTGFATVPLRELLERLQE